MKRIGKCNVILITLDGLRRDYFDKCKNLKSIAQKGVIFSNMVTAAPYTFSSMHAIFSGLYPSTNGVNSYYNMFKFKKDKCKTLTEYLKDAGYYTIANALRDCVLPNQGFDKLIFHKMGDDLAPLHKKILKEASKKKRFFVYLHYTIIHDKYIKIAKKYSDFDREYFNNKTKNKKIYASYVHECNEYVKELMGYIKELGLLKNTVILLHSDHGTSTGDKKGEKIYGCFVYDYTIRTFCVMLIPNYKCTEVKFQCSTIDIMPTILDLLGIKEDKNFEKLQGKSLMPFVDGKEKKDRIAFSETGGLYGPWPSHNEHNVFCVRYKNKKAIYNKTPNTWEFYDLKKDPNEKNNLINKNFKDIKKYKMLLLQKLKENGINLLHI